MKKILIIASNAYALGGIYSNLRFHFNDNSELYFLSNNFFIIKENFYESLKKIDPDNLNNCYIYENYKVNNYQKLNPILIKKNLNEVIKKIKNIQFTEIIVSEYLSAETKYLLSKLIKKDTKLSFIDLHYIDYHLIYKYLLLDKKILKPRVNLRYFLHRIRHEFHLKKIIKENLFKIIEYFVFGFVTRRDNIKSYIRKDHIIHKNKLPIKILSKLYLLFNNYNEIYSKTYNLKKIDKEFLKINTCECLSHSNEKKHGLILVPFFSKGLKGDELDKLEEFNLYINKKIKFFNKEYKINSIYLKPHPRDKTNFVELLKSLLEKKNNGINFQISNEVFIDKNFFCKFKFIFGVSSLVRIATRYCQKILPITSFNLFIKNRYRDKALFVETYSSKSDNYSEKEIVFLD